MKDALIFLGSGASVPFGLPTMKQFVFEFEKHLKQIQKHDSSDDVKEMLLLYEDIKNTLLQIHGYTDLESVFSVVEILSRNVQYADLGFPSSYLISKMKGNISGSRITNESQKTVSKNLLEKYMEFVRERLAVSEDLQDQIFYEFYDTISKEHHDSTIQTKEIDGKKFLILDYIVYTTNYDLIQEKYWQGVTEINDLIERDDRDREILDLRRLPENYSYRGPPKQIKYVKLHGSLNLYRLSDGQSRRNGLID